MVENRRKKKKKREYNFFNMLTVTMNSSVNGTVIMKST